METTYVYSGKIDNQQIVSNCLYFHNTVVPQEECVSAKMVPFLDYVMS